MCPRTRPPRRAPAGIVLGERSAPMWRSLRVRTRPSPPTTPGVPWSVGEPPSRWGRCPGRTPRRWRAPGCAFPRIRPLLWRGAQPMLCAVRRARAPARETPSSSSSPPPAGATGHTATRPASGWSPRAERCPHTRQLPSPFPSAKRPSFSLRRRSAPHASEATPSALRRTDQTGAVLLIDAANVVGSRPTGWWRDRAGAARTFVQQVRAAVASGRIVQPVVVVLESKAREGVMAGAADGVTVLHATGSGDDMLVDVAGDSAEQGVTLVTADRELRRRAEAVGAQVVGPQWLFARLGS